MVFLIPNPDFRKYRLGTKLGQNGNRLSMRKWVGRIREPHTSLLLFIFSSMLCTL